MPKVIVIGAGWNGLVTAKVLADQGYEVTVYDKHEDILQGISGTFGTRQHSGAHYPRSQITKAHCQKAIPAFNALFQDMLLDYGPSIYAYNDTDTTGANSKITLDTFKVICKSLSGQPINTDATNIKAGAAFSVTEKYFPIGEALRKQWKEILADTPNITIKTNCEVSTIKILRKKCIVTTIAGNIDKCDYLVNATAFQDLLPQQTPENIDVIFQPTLAFVYEIKNPHLDLYSVTFMDGANPALMPYHDGSGKHKILVTHCKYGILSTYKTMSDANSLLNNLTSEQINTLRIKVEADLQRLYPMFNTENFLFLESVTTTNTKVVSNQDFRSTIVVKENINNIYYMIPGKIGDAVKAAEELKALILQSEQVFKRGGFTYLSSGTYEKATVTNKETCSLQEAEIGNTAYQDALPPIIRSPQKIQPKAGIKRSSSSLLVEQSMFQGQPIKKAAKLTPVNLMKRFKAP